MPELLQSVADLGLLRADGDRDQILRDSVQSDCAQWFNNLRFASRGLCIRSGGEADRHEALDAQAGSQEFYDRPVLRLSML